jgi:chromosome segregation ATPase
VPGVDESRANNQALSKQIFGLESRLEQSQRRCSATLVQNKRLRERITKLREERIENDASYAEAEKQLIEKRAELTRITAESIEAYETRDAAHVELRRLRAQEEREQAEFEKEWREMARMMERDKLLKDFMRTERAKLKGKERNESEGAARRVRRLANALRITARATARPKRPAPLLLSCHSARRRRWMRTNVPRRNRCGGA